METINKRNKIITTKILTYTKLSNHTRETWGLKLVLTTIPCLKFLAQWSQAEFKDLNRVAELLITGSNWAPAQISKLLFKFLLFIYSYKHVFLFSLLLIVYGVCMLTALLAGATLVAHVDPFSGSIHLFISYFFR